MFSVHHQTTLGSCNKVERVVETSGQVPCLESEVLLDKLFADVESGHDCNPQGDVRLLCSLVTVSLSNLCISCGLAIT